MHSLLNSARLKGVEVLCNARALAPVTNGSTVVGVTARIDMREVCISARRGVILAAGGFIMNEDMVTTYAPTLSRGNWPNGNPNDTGGGIRIGMAAGGSITNMHEGFICTPFYPPHQFLESIIVNECGARFINEDVYHGRLGSAILERQDGRYYLVIDSRHFDVLDRAPMGGYPVAGTGDSIEELEKELHLPPEALAQTLHAYNKHASAGVDPEHHKNPKYLLPLDSPPYAAFDLTPGNGAIFATMTFGGLDTKPTGEVLNTEKAIVPGLYAAGRNSAGLPRSAAGYASGMSIGDATFFGRLAGQSAASRNRGSSRIKT